MLLLTKRLDRKQLDGPQYLPNIAASQFELHWVSDNHRKSICSRTWSQQDVVWGGVGARRNEVAEAMRASFAALLRRPSRRAHGWMQSEAWLPFFGTVTSIT